MEYKVTGKQENSNMCLICGLNNPAGLKTSFYTLENGDLVGLFTPGEEHQGYPGRLHGGISAAVLDETIGRAIAKEAGETVWGVTVEINLKYRKPVPLGVELRAVGRIVSEHRRFFEGTGEILLPDGSVAVEGWGRYMKLPIDTIAQGEDLQDLDWKVVPASRDPQKIDLP